MRCVYAVALLGLLALISHEPLAPHTAVAQTPRPNRELQTKLRALLVELDANQRATRQKAERELLDLGPEILPLLPPPELLPNQAVRSAVARVRVELERRRAQDSIRASRITTPQNLTLREFLHQVETQTTNRIDTAAVAPNMLESRINAAFNDQPFWPALEGLLSEKHLRYQFAADASTLQLVAETAPDADAAWSTAADGPFRVSVNWVRPRKVAGNKQIQRLRTELAVAPEPRLRALFLKLAANNFRATGPTGKVFTSADPAAQFDLPLGEGGRYVRWNLDFSAPAGLAESDIFPLKIEGQAAMQIAASSEHIRFTDLVDGEGTARRRGGVTVSLQRIKSRTAEDGTLSVSVKVLVVYDTGGPAFESHRTWIFHNQVYLDRREGESLPPNGGFETDLQGNGSVGVTYRFDGLKEPLKDLQFVYVAPTLIIDAPFKIELQNISPPKKN